MELSFCSEYDRLLAHAGVPAVFLRDREQAWRFDPEWSRNAWERAEGPHAAGWRWVLFRDHGSGFVVLLLVTAPTLLLTHPRGALRVFEELEEAEAVLASLGPLPIAEEPW